MESVLCEASANLLFTYNHDCDTRFSQFLDFSISRFHTSSRFFVDHDKAFLTWCLESADIENSDRKPLKLRPSGCLEKLDPR